MTASLPPPSPPSPAARTRATRGPGASATGSPVSRSPAPPESSRRRSRRSRRAHPPAAPAAKPLQARGSQQTPVGYGGDAERQLHDGGILVPERHRSGHEHGGPEQGEPAAHP